MTIKIHETKRYKIKVSLICIEDPKGDYIKFDELIKHGMNDKNLCAICRKNKTCNPHNKFKIIAIQCDKFIKRK